MFAVGTGLVAYMLSVSHKVTIGIYGPKSSIKAVLILHLIFTLPTLFHQNPATGLD